MMHQTKGAQMEFTGRKPSGADLMRVLVELLEEQEKVKVDYKIVEE